jgi:hypothetical protein
MTIVHRNSAKLRQLRIGEILCPQQVWFVQKRLCVPLNGDFAPFPLRPTTRHLINLFASKEDTSTMASADEKMHEQLRRFVEKRMPVFEEEERMRRAHHAADDSTVLVLRAASLFGLFLDEL